MKAYPKYFEKIRIRPEKDAELKSHAPLCQWDGCREPGTHRAPVGRMKEGEYFRFCFEHVKEYNKSFNYFSGLADTDVARFQKEALTGHRPTWKLGVNSKAARMAQRGRVAGGAAGPEVQDGFNIFGARAGQEASKPESRVGILARKALDTLGLDDSADKAAIKARYKELVKRFHPDANAGDRSREGTLQEILKAYQTLKAQGLV